MHYRVYYISYDNLCAPQQQHRVETFTGAPFDQLQDSQLITAPSDWTERLCNCQGELIVVAAPRRAVLCRQILIYRLSVLVAACCFSCVNPLDLRSCHRCNFIDVKQIDQASKARHEIVQTRKYFSQPNIRDPYEM